MKFLKLFEEYEDCLSPKEVKRGMRGVVKVQHNPNDEYNEVEFVVDLIFKPSDLSPTEKNRVRRIELYKQVSDLPIPDYLHDKIKTVITDELYNDKYIVLVHQNVFEGMGMMQIYVYGKDILNGTVNKEFCVPRWNVNNREKLKNVNHITGVFESLNFDASLQKYYNVIRDLPQYFKNLRAVKLTDSDDGRGISFESIDKVTAEENEYHVGEYWEFTIGIWDGQIEVVCDNSGDNNEINSVAEMIDYCVPNFPNVKKLADVWKDLIKKHPEHTLECPEYILQEIGKTCLANAKKIGVFESLADDLDVRMVPYYNVVKWCNYFQDIIITIKNGHKTVIFNNDRNGRNQISISKANLLFCQFGEFSDRIELDSLEQFIDLCSQDLASKDLFNLDPKAYTDHMQHRDAENEMFDARRASYNLSIWSITLQHDSSYKVFCPVEILNKLGFTKIADVKRIGVLDESLTANEVKKDMTFYVKQLDSQWCVGEIWYGIDELIAYVEKEKLKDEFDWSLYVAIKEDNFQESHYNYMLKHKDEYKDKTILFVYDFEQTDDEENWCFVIYGYDKNINTAIFCDPDYIFEIDDINRWKTSDELIDSNKKTGVLENNKYIMKTPKVTLKEIDKSTKTGAKKPAIIVKEKDNSKRA